ncbi:MAG: preprotein translocase subunit SecE [Candidatus Omnitrophica bacterium]|nr:preprotein translocase subunit SecE [Candidatus Omnitrophota bacterium]
MIKKIKTLPKFFKEVREEFQRINWASRQELLSATAIVIVVAAFLTTYIGVIDLGLSQAVRFFLQY